MNKDITDNELVVADLIHNQSIYIDLCKDIIKQREDVLNKEDKLLHEDIEKNFVSFCKTLIKQELCKRLPVSVDNVIIIVESLNLKEYLGML